MLSKAGERPPKKVVGFLTDMWYNQKEYDYYVSVYPNIRNITREMYKSYGK